MTEMYNRFYPGVLGWCILYTVQYTIHTCLSQESEGEV